MPEDLYEKMKKMEKGGSSKKILALVLVIVVLVSVIGYLLYSGYGPAIFPGAERIETPEDAANTLSNLGNAISGISEDLKDIEKALG